MTLGTDSRFHLMSPIAACQPPSGQLRAAAFQSSRPGQATNMWTNHSTICLKATLCFLDNGRRPKHTHSSVYDCKVSILLMVPSPFPRSCLCCVSLVPGSRCSALCLPCFHPPASKLPCHCLLLCPSSVSPQQRFSPSFRPLVRFSLITRLPLPLFSCLPGTASFPCLCSFPAFAQT